MNTTFYIPNYIQEPGLERLLTEVPWIAPSEARSECFMSGTPYSYTYGKGRGVRTYTSIPFCAGVAEVMEDLNLFLPYEFHWGEVNGCFLNRYDHQHQALGWHADDFVGMDHTRPVAVISFGEPRFIWWKKIGEEGLVPDSQKQLLGNGSLFVMAPGMQHTHYHRIPKGDRNMGPRVSLTFRAFKGLE